MSISSTSPTTNSSQIAGEKLAYSIPEACAALSLGRSKLYMLISDGKIQARKIGSRTLIPAASLRRLIEGEAA